MMIMGGSSILPSHSFILPKLHKESHPARYIVTCASTVDPVRRCDHVCVYNPVTAAHQGSRAKITNIQTRQTAAIKPRSERDDDSLLSSLALGWIKMSAARACVCFGELDEPAAQKRPLLD